MLFASHYITLHLSWLEWLGVSKKRRFSSSTAGETEGGEENVKEEEAEKEEKEKFEKEGLNITI